MGEIKYDTVRGDTFLRIVCALIHHKPHYSTPLSGFLIICKSITHENE